MGSNSSKAAQTASKLSAANTARKYPTRTPPPSSNRTNVEPERPQAAVRTGPSVHPPTHASGERDQAITQDSLDPDLALQSRLRRVGPVQPLHQSNSSTFNQTQTQAHQPDSPQSQFPSTTFAPSTSTPSQTIFPSNSPLQNPAVSLLTARYRLAEEAEKEFGNVGRASAGGRQFLDVLTLRQVLGMRDQGKREAEIERELGLKSGVVGRLGRKGVVGLGGA